jgi:arsenate reductase
MVTRVLFAGVRNAARTQVAEAWFKALACPASASALSCGTSPAPAVDEQVRIAMIRAGVNVASKPRLLTPLLLSSADVVVVIGPPVPALPVRADDEWAVDDPVGTSPDRICEIGHQIEQRVRSLIVSRGWDPLGANMPPAG